MDCLPTIMEVVAASGVVRVDDLCQHLGEEEFTDVPSLLTLTKTDIIQLCDWEPKSDAEMFLNVLDVIRVLYDSGAERFLMELLKAGITNLGTLCGITDADFVRNCKSVGMKMRDYAKLRETLSKIHAVGQNANPDVEPAESVQSTRGQRATPGAEPADSVQSTAAPSTTHLWRDSAAPSTTHLWQDSATPNPTHLQRDSQCSGQSLGRPCELRSSGSFQPPSRVPLCEETKPDVENVPLQTEPPTPTQTTRDFVEVHHATGFVQSLFKNARTGARVRTEVMHLGKEIQQLRITNWHTTQARELIACVLGELEQTDCGKFGLQADTQSVKIAVEKLNASVVTVCATVNARIKTHIQIAEVCSHMATQAFVVQESMHSLQQSGMMNVDGYICGDAVELCKNFRILLGKIQPADLNTDVETFERLASEVIKTLGYADMLEASEEKTVREALEKRKELLDRANEALTKRVECERRIVHLERKMNICTSTFDAKQKEITAEHLRLKAALEKKTLGSHKLRGRAPAEDVRAQEIVKLWNAGEFHQLKQHGSYSIAGVFSYEFDHALTDKQAEVKDMINARTMEEDLLKNEHEDDMTKLQRDLDIERGILPRLKKEEGNASKDYDKVSTPLSDEKLLSFFKARNPAQFNKMICLFKVHRLVSQAVRWMKVFDGAAQLKLPLEQKLRNVERAASEKRGQLCVWFLDELSRYLTMPDASMAALLRTTGVSELQNVMMPEFVDDDEIQKYREAPAVD